MTHPRSPLALTLLLAVLPATSCGLFSEHHSFKDQGRMCVLPEAARDAFVPPAPSSRSYAANQRLAIQVTMPDCLSSSCSHDAHADCTAEVKGTTIQVTSRGSYNEDKSGPCTLDCGSLVAHCLTGPLPAGTYEIRHGNATVSLTVPSTVDTPCAGTAP